MLENDLFLERFLRQYGQTLTVRQADSLNDLMALAAKHIGEGLDSLGLVKLLEAVVGPFVRRLFPVRSEVKSDTDPQETVPRFPGPNPFAFPFPSVLPLVPSADRVRRRTSRGVPSGIRVGIALSSLTSAGANDLLRHGAMAMQQARLQRNDTLEEARPSTNRNVPDSELSVPFQVVRSNSVI